MANINNTHSAIDALVRLSTQIKLLVSEKHDQNKVECHLSYIKMFEEVASCVVLCISVFRTKLNKVTSR